MAAWRLTIHGTQDGQTTDVVMGFQSALIGNDDAAAALLCAQAVGQEWGLRIVPQLVDDYTFMGAEAVSVYNPQFAGQASYNSIGGSTDAPLPMFVVAKVRLYTGLRGRSYQGRWGVPALGEGRSDPANGNALTVAAAGALDAAVGQFYASLNAAGYQAIVISRYTNGVKRPAPITTTVTSYSVEIPLGSRISRKG